MEYVIFMIMAVIMLLVLILELGVLIGGMGQGKLRCGNGSSVHNGGSDNGDSCVVGECDGEKLDGCSYRLDNETAIIALKMIKHDLTHMLSDTENRALDYAAEKLQDTTEKEQNTKQLAKKIGVKLLDED